MIGILLNFYLQTSYRFALARAMLNEHRSLSQTLQAIFFSVAQGTAALLGKVLVNMRFLLRHYWPLGETEERQLNLASNLFQLPVSTLYPADENVQAVVARNVSLQGLAAGNILNNLQFFDNNQWQLIWQSYNRLPHAQWNFFQQIDIANPTRREFLIFILQQNPDLVTLDALLITMSNPNRNIAALYRNRAEFSRADVLNIEGLSQYDEVIINLIWPVAPDRAAPQVPAVPFEPEAAEELLQPEGPVRMVEPEGGWGAFPLNEEEEELPLGDAEIAAQVAELPEDEVGAFLENQRNLRLRREAEQERAAAALRRTPADDVIDELRATYSQYAQNRPPLAVANAVIAEPQTQQAIAEIERALLINLGQALEQIELNDQNLDRLVFAQLSNRYWAPQLQQICIQIIFQREYVEFPDGADVRANQTFSQEIEYLQGLLSDLMHERLVQTLTAALPTLVEEKRQAALQALAEQQAAQALRAEQEAAARPDREVLRQGVIPLQFTDINTQELQRERLRNEITSFFNKLNTDLTQAFISELSKSAVIARFRSGLQQAAAGVVQAQNVREYLAAIVRDDTYINLVTIFENTQREMQGSYPEALAWGSDNFQRAKETFLSRSGDHYEDFFESLLANVIKMRGVSTLMRPQRLLMGGKV